MKICKSLFLMFLVLMLKNTFAQNAADNKMKVFMNVKGYVAFVNDDSKSDEYRFNFAFMGGTEHCHHVKSKPGVWHFSTYNLQGEGVYPNTNCRFGFDFFEDAACGGYNCSFNNSCGLISNDKRRCRIGYDINVASYSAGVWNNDILLYGFCGGDYALLVDFLYTPSRPDAIIKEGYNVNVCSGEQIKLQATTIHPEATIKWIRVFNGVEQVLPETGLTCIDIAPFVSAGTQDLYYKAYTIINGTWSLTYKESIPMKVMPPAPKFDNTSEYLSISHNPCFGYKQAKVQVKKVIGAGVYRYTLERKDTTLSLNYTGSKYPVFPDDADDKLGLTGLPSGNYRLTISRAGGADGDCFTSVDFVIKSPIPVNKIIPKVVKYNGYDVRCHGDSGALGFIPSGGTAPYIINVYDSLHVLVKSTSPGSLGKFYPGKYYVDIVDVNNCPFEEFERKITQPPQLNSNIYEVDISCAGLNDGSIFFATKGGVSPYTYSIDSGITNSPNNYYPDLYPGVYKTQIKDKNDCIAINTVIISEPSQLDVRIDTIIDNPCYGDELGQITFYAVGGTAPFAYSYNGSAYGSDSVFKNLKAGIFPVYIKDKNGCMDSIEAKIKEPLALKALSSVEQVTCTGFNNGSITISPEGGTAPYSYLWFNGSKGSIVKDLSPGKYKVNIKDAKGCSLIEEIQVTQPKDSLEVEVVHKKDSYCDIKCIGEAEVKVSGGIPPYHFKWNDKDGSITNFVNKLCKGNYKVEVADSNNCVSYTIVEIHDSINFNTLLPGVVTVCPGENYKPNIGISSMSCLWKNDKGFYSIENTPLLSDSGIYHLMLTNPEGCNGYDTLVLRKSPDMLNAKFLLPTEVVLGDTVSLTEISWPMPDSIYWNFGGGKMINTNEVIPSIVFESSGTYTITLTAFLGTCVDSVTKQITFNLPGAESRDTIFNSFNGIYSLKLYPNPNQGTFNIEFGLDKPEEVELVIYNSYSIAMHSRKLNPAAQFELPISLMVNKGVYFLKLSTFSDFKIIAFVVN